MSDDVIFTICSLCSAKKYVLIPNAVYFYRLREDSLIHKNFDLPRHLHLWVMMLKAGLTYLDEFLNRSEFFSQRSDLKYALFNLFVNEMVMYLADIYAKVPAHKLDELLRKEFSTDDNTALMTFIFSKMNIQRLQLMQAQQQFNQFAAQAKARIAELESEIARLKNKE